MVKRVANKAQRTRERTTQGTCHMEITLSVYKLNRSFFFVKIVVSGFASHVFDTFNRL
jgi:hypothetical protein